jgi:phage shock protein C
MSKKIYKNKAQGKICGVCAGIAEFFDIDVTIVRIIWAFAIIVGGTGLLAYILCALIMPDKSEIDFNNNNF